MGLLPAGEYDFEVRKAEDSKTGPNSKNPGTDIINLELTVYTPSGGKKTVFDMLHPAMEVKVYNFCKMAELLDEYNSGELKAHHCEGINGRVKIKIKPEDEKNGYAAKNEVANYIVPKQETTPSQGRKPPVVKDDDLSDSEIPF